MTPRKESLIKTNKDWECVREGIRMCLGRYPGLDDKEDIEQDAMLRAVTFQHQFRGDSLLSTWAFSIANNVLKQHLLKKTRRKAEVTFSDLGVDSYPDSDDLQAADESWHECSSTFYASEDLREYLLQNTYHTNLRNLIHRELHGMQYSEIAKLYDIPVGTAKSSVSRARCVLKKGLTELCDHSIERKHVPTIVKLALEQLSRHFK